VVSLRSKKHDSVVMPYMLTSAHQPQRILAFSKHNVEGNPSCGAMMQPHNLINLWRKHVAMGFICMEFMCITTNGEVRRGRGTGCSEVAEHRHSILCIASSANIRKRVNTSNFATINAFWDVSLVEWGNVSWFGADRHGTITLVMPYSAESHRILFTPEVEFQFIAEEAEHC